MPIIWLCGDAHETGFDNSYNGAYITVGCLLQEKGNEVSLFYWRTRIRWHRSSWHMVMIVRTQVGSIKKGLQKESIILYRKHSNHAKKN